MPYTLRLTGSLLAISFVFTLSHAEAARPVIPGTGTLIDYVGDDFEDTSWSFINNFPKSSREQDERLRSPTGKSTNDRWKEGPERGQPDHMKVVPNPPGALPGSNYGLLIRTLNSGIPGYKSRTVQQDDLIANCISRLGMSIPVGDMPNVVTRVYLPPADQWEKRTGPQFGFRISASTVATERVSTGFFGSRSETKVEPYWPGIWIHFKSKGSRGAKEDGAFLAIRGDRMGRDITMKQIPVEQFGWWTLGMSVTGDGQIHYYAKQGVGNLTAADHISSQFPYSYSARTFRTFFFDACNRDDGKTWSTPFIIDDPQLYVVNASRVVASVDRKIKREAQRQASIKKQKEMQAKRKAEQQAKRKAMQEKREAQQQARREAMKKKQSARNPKKSNTSNTAMATDMSKVEVSDRSQSSTKMRK